MSEELCDDKLMTTVDGFFTLNDCTGSNLTLIVLSMCAAQSSHRIAPSTALQAIRFFRHANNHDDENPCATMAPNMNVQSNASEKVFVLAVRHVVGMRGPATPIVMVKVTMMVMFLLCGRIVHPFSPRRGPSHSDGIKYDRVEPGAPSAPPKKARVYHRQLSCALKCVRFFIKKSASVT